jgi:hypothetical protein
VLQGSCQLQGLAKGAGVRRSRLCSYTAANTQVRQHHGCTVTQLYQMTRGGCAANTAVQLQRSQHTGETARVHVSAVPSGSVSNGCEIQQHSSQGGWRAADSAVQLHSSQHTGEAAPWLYCDTVCCSVRNLCWPRQLAFG